MIIIIIYGNNTRVTQHKRNEILDTELFETKEETFINKVEKISPVSEFDQKIEKILHGIFQQDDILQQYKMKAVTHNGSHKTRTTSIQTEV